MKSLKNMMQKFWKDESAQGAAEYVLLLVVVVALVAIFRDKIKGAFSSRVETLGNDISGFTGEGK